MKKLLCIIVAGVLGGGAVAENITSPTNISDCVLWLDAGQGVTESGGVISEWADQSSASNDLTQATAAHQPALISDAVNSKSAVSFAKGATDPDDNDFLSNSALQLDTTVTLFFVIKPDGPLDSSQRFAGHYGNGAFRFNSGKASIWTSGGNADLSTPLPSTGEFQIIAYRFNSNVQISINGSDFVVTISSASMDNSDFVIGGVANSSLSPNYGSFDGDFAEIIVYDKVLTDADFNRVGYYLAEKYNLSTDFIPLEATSYIYDFEGLTASGYPGTTLNGQDGWVHSGSTLDKITVQTGIDIRANDLARESVYRTNDVNWSFEIPADAVELSVSYYARIGNATGNSWNRSSEIAIMDGSTNAFKIGFDGYALNKWRLRDIGSTYLADSAATTVSSEDKYIKIIVGLAADSDGEGWGSLYESTDGTNWTAVPGLQNKDLQLATRGMDDFTLWDRLFVDMQNGSAIDDILVKVVHPYRWPVGTVIIIR